MEIRRGLFNLIAGTRGPVVLVTSIGIEAKIILSLVSIRKKNGIKYLAPENHMKELQLHDFNDATREQAHLYPCLALAAAGGPRQFGGPSQAVIPKWSVSG